MEPNQTTNIRATVVRGPTRETLNEITRERFAELKRKRRIELVRAEQEFGKKFNGIRGLNKIKVKP